jgi:hypothetical protein
VIGPSTKNFSKHNLRSGFTQSYDLCGMFRDTRMHSHSTNNLSSLSKKTTVLDERLRKLKLIEKLTFEFKVSHSEILVRFRVILRKIN